jgi:hypothetical protein
MGLFAAARDEHWVRDASSRVHRVRNRTHGRDAQSGRVEAIVVRKPFIDPEKDVPKQQVTATAEGKTTSPI